MDAGVGSQEWWLRLGFLCTNMAGFTLEVWMPNSDLSLISDYIRFVGLSASIYFQKWPVSDICINTLSNFAHIRNNPVCVDAIWLPNHFYAKSTASTEENRLPPDNKSKQHFAVDTSSSRQQPGVPVRVWSWILIDTDNNRIIIWAPAFRSIFSGVQNIFRVELLFWGLIVVLSGTPTKYSVSQPEPAE